MGGGCGRGDVPPNHESRARGRTRAYRPPLERQVVRCKSIQGLIGWQVEEWNPWKIVGAHKYPTAAVGGG